MKPEKSMYFTKQRYEIIILGVKH